MFWAVRPQDGQRVAVASAPILERRISLTLTDVPLGVAVQRIAAQAGLDVTFSTELLRPGARASIEADDVTVAAALKRVLASAQVDVVVSSADRLTLVAHATPTTATDSSGILSGTLVDRESGQPVSYGAVTLLGTDRGIVADAAGGFRIAGLPFVEYHLRAHRIGYVSVDTTIVLAANAADAGVTVRMQRAAAQMPGDTVRTVRFPGEMPATVRGYKLARGPFADSSGGTDYKYQRREDSVMVSITRYDVAAKLGTKDDTLALLYDDYSVAHDSLYAMAQQNDAALRVYTHEEDDLHIEGHAYRGFVYRWTWEIGDAQEKREARLNGDLPVIGCDAGFLTQRAKFGSSCYQQTFALPEGLLRVWVQLSPGESVSNGELFAFSKELVAALEHQ